MLTLSGITTLTKLVQYPKAFSPIFVTLLPKITLVRLPQCSNAIPADAGDAVRHNEAYQRGAIFKCIVPYVVTLVAYVMFVRLMQYYKCRVPDIGDARIKNHVGQVKTVWNAEAPMVLTLAPITTLVKIESDPKSHVANADNRLAIGCGRDDHRTTGLSRHNVIYSTNRRC